MWELDSGFERPLDREGWVVRLKRKNERCVLFFHEYEKPFMEQIVKEKLERLNSEANDESNL